MSVEANKTIARRYFEELLNKGNLAVADEILATNIIVDSSLQTVIHGVENVKQSMAGFRAAFPDQHFTIEDEIGEGDKVVVRYVYRGTHQGEFQGIAPTGKQVAVAGIAIYQITGGRIEEVWVASDSLGLMQQLGAVPAPGQGGS
ncbi:MAG: ester cyclase [Anaerolineae bacterium]|nr:ester cyclase [Anaerolineae bacterium]